MQNYALIKCPHTYLLLVLEKKENKRMKPILLVVGVTGNFRFTNPLKLIDDLYKRSEVS